MRVILADYHLTSTFRVPKGVPLLEESENICDKAWSWWIKWDTLHYIDAEGDEHTIDAYHSASHSDFKRPDKVEMEEEDTDDDE